MEGERFAICLLMQFLLMLMVPDVIHSLSYPILMTKRFGQSGSTYLPAYISMPARATDRFSEPEVPDDDNYAYLTESEDYDGYRYVPVHGYADDRSEPVFDFEQDTWDDTNNEGVNYPYGQETWFESERAEPSRDAILARTLSDYSETDRNYVPYVYGKSVEFSPDDEDGYNRKWSYGVPVMEEREKTANEDESVRELESLRRQIKSNEYQVPREGGRKIGSEEKNLLGDNGNSRNLNFETQINRSSRKNNVPAGKDHNFAVNRKRAFTSENRNAKSDLFTKNNSPKASAGTGKDESSPEEKSGAQSTTALPSTQSPSVSKLGQKEYVLPRPASPVRKPFQRNLFTRSPKNASVYETIKKLLAMEEGFKTKEVPRIQKRFVLSGDELASELSGLKKTVV